MEVWISEHGPGQIAVTSSAEASGDGNGDGTASASGEMVLALAREMLQQPLVLLLMLATKASAMTTRAMRILFLILGEIGARKTRKRKRTCSKALDIFDRRTGVGGGGL